jgi:hypothetical protein
MARPAPGRTGDERESSVAAGFRCTNVHRGPQIVLSAGHSTKPCLADPLVGFAHGAFRKSPFLFSGKSENSRAEPDLVLT